MHRERGHSLLESLVVVAIISVMLAIALPHYAKAIRLAKQVGADEAKRQRMIGRLVDGAESQALRDTARLAYRQVVDAGRFETAVTEMLYVVAGDAEFEAYWNTLINPDNTSPLRLDGERLVAEDFSGNTYVLNPVWNSNGELSRGNFPIEWDFLSTNLADMPVGNMGATVQFTSHLEYITYPGPFPVTPTVATLSRRFMVEVWPTLE